MKHFLIAISCTFITSVLFAQKESADKIPVLIRCDDIGMCHSVNEAAKAVLETGIPVSMSVMVPCPWFTEAVEMLKQYKNVAVGIHLTLNSEWKQYRWGPVAGARVVPSLVDSVGNFFPSRALLFANNPKLNEIETELRAQIEKALKAGLKLEYLDYHMSAPMQTLETRAIVEKLAGEYKLAISRYYDEVDASTAYFVPPISKKDTLIANLAALKTGGTKLFVFHVGLDDTELGAMEDLNEFGPKDMSKHRNAEFNALVSQQFQQLLHNSKYRLVNYRIMNEEKGLKTMKRPKLD